MFAPADLLSQLSDEQLAAFRAQYNPDFLIAAARGAVAAPHPSAGGYVDWVVGYLYDGKRLKPADRERCLVSLIAAQSTSNSLFLAVHLYWGLMEGISVAELADTLALTGVYTGLTHYTAGQGSLRATLEAMADLASQPDAKLDPASVVAALRKNLP